MFLHDGPLFNCPPVNDPVTPLILLLTAELAVLSEIITYDTRGMTVLVVVVAVVVGIF